MKKIDTLLKLIDEGNEEKILAEKELRKSFNKLCEYELIEIKEDGIFLTEVGRKAKREGAAKIIRIKENEKFTREFTPKKINKEKFSFKLSLVLLILILILFIFINIV